MNILSKVKTYLNWHGSYNPTNFTGEKNYIIIKPQYFTCSINDRSSSQYQTNHSGFFSPVGMSSRVQHYPPLHHKLQAHAPQMSIILCDCWDNPYVSIPPSEAHQLSLGMATPGDVYSCHVWKFV